MQRTITFDRDGLTLVGNLFTPEGFDESARYDAVIVQGSFSSVKELMPAAYAERFAAQGFVTLAFDYAHYEQSEGEPRQLESPPRRSGPAGRRHLPDRPAVLAHAFQQRWLRHVVRV